MDYTVVYTTTNENSMRLILLLLLSATIGGGPSAVAEEVLWRCVDLNGKEVFADQILGLKDCQRYDVKTEKSGGEPGPHKVGTEVISPPLSQQTPAGPEKRTAIDSSTGMMDFGTYNRLSLEMTEAEVLSLAGSPKSKLGDAWVYSSLNASIIELRFGSSRIVEMRNYSPK